MSRHRLVHVTEFHYDGLVSESYNVVRLRPRDAEHQSCRSFTLNTTPASRAATYVDHWGNAVHSFNILGEHRKLRIETQSIVHLDRSPDVPPDTIMLRDLDAARDELDAYFDFLAPTGYVPHPQALTSLIEESERLGGGSVAGMARAAAALVHDRFSYVQGATHVQSTVLDALTAGAGVCQDFAHVMLAMMRMRGIPARYVSGYLVPPSNSNGTSIEDVIGGQASHAWMEVMVPGFGWFGLDPTMGEPIGPRHVHVAHGRDYADAAPVRGVYKGHAGQQLFVDVGLRPVLDDDGQERLQETAAAPPPSETFEEGQMVQGQQQQQQ